MVGKESISAPAMLLSFRVRPGKKSFIFYNSYCQARHSVYNLIIGFMIRKPRKELNYPYDRIKTN